MEETNDQEKGSENKPLATKKTEMTQGKSHTAITVAAIIIVLVVGIGAFLMGRLSHYAYNRSDRFVVGMREPIRGGYYRGGGMMHEFTGSRFDRDDNSGKITNINGDIITVSINDKDQPVLISSDTAIYNSSGDIISKNDLKVNDEVIIAGRPNSSGQIAAEMIRVK